MDPGRENNMHKTPIVRENVKISEKLQDVGENEKSSLSKRSHARL
jgi:hypothetical protein